MTREDGEREKKSVTCDRLKIKSRIGNRRAIEKNELRVQMKRSRREALHCISTARHGGNGGNKGQGRRGETGRRGKEAEGKWLAANYQRGGEKKREECTWNPEHTRKVEKNIISVTGRSTEIVAEPGGVEE